MKALLVSTLLFVHFNVFAQKIAQKAFSEDLTQFESFVLGIHPATADSLVYTAVQQEIAEFQANPVDSLSMQEAHWKLRKALSRLHCGHSYLFYPLRNNPDSLCPTYFPLQIQELSGKVVVVKTHLTKQDSIPSGTIIEQINGIPIDTLLHQLRYTPGRVDSPSQTVQRKITCDRFAMAYATRFGIVPEFNIRVKSVEDKKVKNLIIKAENYFYLPKSIILKPINLKFVDQDKIAVLEINSFHNTVDQLFEKKQLKKVFRKIKRRRVDKLIIDIRGNQGGSNNNLTELLQYLLSEDFQVTHSVSIKSDLNREEMSISSRWQLWRSQKQPKGPYTLLPKLSETSQPKKRLVYTGDLIVLMDHATFSAATIFASTIQAQGRGLLMGSESAGSARQTFGGIFESKMLKNSKIVVGIPTIRFEYGSQDQPPHNLKPDIYVENTALDILQNKDRVLDAAIDLLRSE